MSDASKGSPLEGSELVRLPALELEGFRISIKPNGCVHISGAIASREPDPAIGAFIQRIHQAAERDRRGVLEVDIRDLGFVNSSGIRIFVDWVLAARGKRPTPIYRLRLLAKREITWQRMSLVALEKLAKDVIEVATE